MRATKGEFMPFDPNTVWWVLVALKAVVSVVAVLIEIAEHLAQ